MNEARQLDPADIEIGDDTDDTPDPFVDNTTPWKRDLHAQVVVAMHPDGMTLEQVATLMGPITRERIRQIEAKALEKLYRLATSEEGRGSEARKLLRDFFAADDSARLRPAANPEAKPKRRPAPRRVAPPPAPMFPGRSGTKGVSHG